jgi:hypothetical protein
MLAEAQTKGIVSFGGLKNLEFVDQYYNGGTGSLGSGPGPNYGLEFTANAQAIVSASKGGSGNFIHNPGGYPVMFFQTGNAVTMTATNGVGVALWFYYSALQTGKATVYAGPSGTGTILASITLPPNNSGCTTYKLCVWSAVGVPLSTTAGSITFAGVADYLAIGTIHRGSATGTAPVGSVTFKAAGQIVGVVPVSGGVASITLSSLKVGSTTISAKFQGTGFATVVKSLAQVVN